MIFSKWSISNKKVKINANGSNGITLVALVVTIVILIILAGIAISVTVGDNGIFTKAKEAKRLQITSEAKEKIGTEILDAQVEAIERNEELEQQQVEDIISKYGVLQDDKDTIVLNDTGYEISLLEIYQGTTTSTGSYTENKAKIELLEGQVKRLQEQLDSTSQTGDEKDKKIAELNEKITTVENEKAELQKENDSLTSRVEQVENRVKTIEQQITSINTNITKLTPTRIQGYTTSGNYIENAGYVIFIPLVNAIKYSKITLNRLNAYGINEVDFNKDSVELYSIDEGGILYLPKNKNDGGYAANRGIYYSITVE